MELQNWAKRGAFAFLVLMGVAPGDAAPISAARRPAPKPVRKMSPAAPVPTRIEVHPPQVTLSGKRAYRQLVVTGYFGAEARDLTHAAQWTLSDPKVARVTLGRLEPVTAGRTTLTIRAGGRSTTVPVTVEAGDKPNPVSFQFETLPVLTKQGCSSGSCHGSPQGKGGFSLSLFGYDPRVDQVSLTRDGFNRRVNVLEPTESLILKKPLLEIPHVGGKKLRKTDAAYRILHDWVYEGAGVELPTVECDRIVVTPNSNRELRAPHLKQQLGVTAYFSDGTVRDVTRIATFESSHPAIVSVDADGLITGRSRGQAAVSVRYLDRLESIYLTVVENVPGYAWKPSPEAGVIDRLVHQKLRQLQYLPSGACSDEVFVRRVHLDLTGLLPTAERVRRFLADCAAERAKATDTSITRSKLIDELLESEEYARFWALKKADLMRVSPKRMPEGRADLLAQWLVEATRKNLPYDQFARHLLTSLGDTRRVAAANYFLAIPSAEERTEMTAQIFMGSRLECAKCHNHPFENWTMRDYYSISAVFARTRTDDGEVVVVASGEALHPSTKEVMRPWGMPKAGANSQSGVDRRALFAEWLTRRGNPYFARVEANRIWADLLGRGIVEPVDDFRSSNPPANVELLNALAAEFEKSGFDRKHLIRLICNSRTYQRSTETNRFNETDDALFSHARIRLLSAEQLKDAIGYATRALAPAGEVQGRLIVVRRQLDARTAELASQYAQWLERGSAETAALSFRVGGWYSAGPFPTGGVPEGLKQVFAPEQSLADPVKASGSWRVRGNLHDEPGTILASAPNQVHYLARSLRSAQPRAFTVQVRAADGFKLWLNGRLVHEASQRGMKLVKLDLQPGENRLVLKLVTARPDPPFSVRPHLEDGPTQAAWRQMRGYSPHVVELLSLAPAAREEHAAVLREHQISADARIRDLRSQLVRLESRAEYATQRPYPEASAFTAAFGQPQRETACTCERQTSPTLLQALELLNGGLTYQMTAQAEACYAQPDVDKLIEELYLSALSRRPTEIERTRAREYLQKSGDRTQGVTDLVWTVINMQEFLFQH